jgi:hypothetical protein
MTQECVHGDNSDGDDYAMHNDVDPGSVDFGTRFEQELCDKELVEHSSTYNRIMPLSKELIATLANIADEDLLAESEAVMQGLISKAKARAAAMKLPPKGNMVSICVQGSNKKKTKITQLHKKST